MTRPTSAEPHVVHPYLFAAFPVLALLRANVSQLEFYYSLIPLLAVVAGAAVIYQGLRLALRKKHDQRVGLGVTLALVLFFSFGHFTPAMLGVREGWQLVEWAALFTIGVVAILMLRGDPSPVTRVLNVVGATLVIYNAGLVAHYEVTARTHTVEGAEDVTPAPADAPHVYLIVLDGFGRTDVMRDYFDYDARWFADGLRERGFVVAHDAAANYAQTTLSLAATLNMTYLNWLSEEIGLESDDRRIPQNMIARSLVAEQFKNRGYEFVAFESGYHGTVIDNATIYRGSSQRGPGVRFVEMLVNTTPIGALQRHGFLPQSDLHDVYRDNILYTFEHVQDALDNTKPHFVYAHVVLPHPPFMFDADGNYDPPDGEFETKDASHIIQFNGVEWYKEGYLGAWIYGARRALEAVDGILANEAASPDGRKSVIILQSDHGPGSKTHWELYDKNDVRERLPCLNAFRFPGEPPASLHPALSPVNTFRLVNNHLFDAKLELLEDRHYFSLWARPYRFWDETDKVRAYSESTPPPL